MNRTDAASAAIWAGMGASYEIHVHDLEGNFDELHNFVLKYLPLVIAMTDAVHDVAMTYPEEWGRNLFEDYGTWVVSSFHYDDKLPSHENTVEWLVNNTLNEFSEYINAVQKDSLETILTNIGENFNI